MRVLSRRWLRSHGVRRLACAGLVLAALATSAHSTATDSELNGSPDFRVRVQAALRLGRTGGTHARSDLETGLRDTHPAVRAACAVALVSVGDSAAVPALQKAMRSESLPSVKSSMSDAIEKLRLSGAAGGGAGTSDVASLERAKYVVQLGTMRNSTGQRGDIDSMMRQAARAKAGTIKGAVVLDGPNASILQRASERKIPVLLVDGNLSRLTQSTGRDGGVIVSASVDLLVRRVPQQTIKGTVSGNASVSDDTRNATRALADLQNRAVSGAVESAMSGIGSGIAALAK